MSGTITFSHSIGKKMKHRYQSFTRIGRQFQSLERQVYADWTSVSFPFCQRSCLIWRIMTNTLTNTMTNTYVVIFLSVSIFGRGTDEVYNQMSHLLSIPNVFVSAIFRLITNCTREITPLESTNCTRNGTCWIMACSQSRHFEQAIRREPLWNFIFYH